MRKSNGVKFITVKIEESLMERYRTVADKRGSFIQRLINDVLNVNIEQLEKDSS